MALPMPDPHRSQRHLLAAIHHWAREAGWTPGFWGWMNPDRTLAIEPRAEAQEVAVFLLNPSGSPTGHRPKYIRAETVRQAVDLLVAYGYLPVFFSSAYGQKYREQVEALERAVQL